MTKLIKKSPKRETIFKRYKDDISCDSPGIRLLCSTYWTVRAAALTSISENHSTLRQTWCEAQSENSDSEMRARIGGVSRQMESFYFFFSVELGHLVLNTTDNLLCPQVKAEPHANEYKCIGKYQV